MFFSISFEGNGQQRKSKKIHKWKPFICCWHHFSYCLRLTKCSMCQNTRNKATFNTNWRDIKMHWLDIMQYLHPDLIEFLLIVRNIPLHAIPYSYNLVWEAVTPMHQNVCERHANQSRSTKERQSKRCSQQASPQSNALHRDGVEHLPPSQNVQKYPSKNSSLFSLQIAQFISNNTHIHRHQSSVE